MSTLLELEKHLGECEYQELPSGILIAKHQIVLPESKVFVPESGLLLSECTISIANSLSMHSTPKNVFASTISRFENQTMKGR